MINRAAIDGGSLFRKIILNIHIYSGLVCFSYLLIYGISTLNFNHRFAFTKSPASVVTWSQPLAVPELARTEGTSAEQSLEIRRKNNQAILRALGSFANSFRSPDGEWTGADTYHARFFRPGKEYQIDLHPSQGIVNITQTRAGVWTLIRDLHGAYEVYPDSLLGTTWGWYTNLSVFVVVFGAISGVYLWTARRRERRIGLALLVGAGALSLMLMLLITFHGG
jgi:hypothetical protein